MGREKFFPSRPVGIESTLDDSIRHTTMQSQAYPPFWSSCPYRPWYATQLPSDPADCGSRTLRSESNWTRTDPNRYGTVCSCPVVRVLILLPCDWRTLTFRPLPWIADWLRSACFSLYPCALPFPLPPVLVSGYVMNYPAISP